jgi:hypothetical protein
METTSRTARPALRRTLMGLALAATLGLVATGCGSGGGSDSGSIFPKTTPSSQATTGPTSEPADDPSTFPTIPTGTRSPSPNPDDSTTVTADGAYLQELDPSANSPLGEPADTDCQYLGEYGWTVTQCLSNEQIAYVIEKRPVGGATAWRAGILRFEGGTGWVPELGYADDAGTELTGIKLRTVDLDGNGLKEGVIAFHHQGTGNLLAYDIVSSTTVVGHRELSHGAALVSEHDIVDISAEYPNDEPNCCPAYLQQSKVTATGSHITVTSIARLDPETSDFSGNL